MLLLCALVVGSLNGWADEVTYTFNSKSWGATLDGETANWTSGKDGNSYTSGVQITTGTTGANATSPVSFTMVSKVTVHYHTNKNAGEGTIKIQIGSGSEKSFSVTKPSKDAGLDSKSTDFSIANESGKVKITVNCTTNSVYIESIDITYTDDSNPSSNLKFSDKTPSITFPATSTYSQAPTTAEGYMDEIGASITYEITDNTAGATINASSGLVTVTHEGSVTVKATAAAIEGKFAASNDSYTLTVTDSRSDAAISFTDAEQTTTIGSDYATQALTNDNNVSPITWTSTNTDVATIDVNNGAINIIAAGTTTIKASFAGNDSYKPAEAQYTLTVNKKEAGIAWPNDNVEAKLGRTFTSPVLINPNNLTVTYSKTALSTCADVDSETGEITIKSEGTTKIFATFAGNDEYKDASVSYTLTVIDPDKTVINFNNNDQNVTESYEQAESLSYTIKGVKIDLAEGTGSNKPRMDGATYSSTKYLRLYGNNTMALTAPEGYNFKSILFDFNKGSLKIGNTTYSSSNKTWTGDAHTVTFTGAESTFINSITITYNTENVTITDAKFATYCSENALNFGATDVKAYKAKVENGRVKLTEIENGVVPANTGMILYCEKADTYAIPVTTTEATVSDNEMVGVLERTQVLWNVGDKYNYILQQGKFNMATDGYLKANRAYLSTEYDVTSAGARSMEIIFDDGEVTSIEDVRSKLSDMSGDFFDLQGRKVANPTKGLYIVNGKKVVVK